jgi:Fe-S cluster biosynthesis and repair protein YggX
VDSPSTTAATTVDQPASATVTPTATTPPAEPGPVPYQRFNEVNLRMKEAETAARTVRERLGDLVDVDPGELRQSRQLFAALRNDPSGTLGHMVLALQNDPEQGPKVASALGRLLSGFKRQGGGEAEEVEPQPDLQADNGTPLYSAPQLRKWQAWQQKQTEAAFQKRLSPLENLHTRLTQAENMARANQQADAQASQMVAEARQWDGFKDHESDIIAALDANPRWGLERAYIEVMRTKVLPSYQAKAQADAVAKLTTTAAASTGSPSAGTGAASDRPTEITGELMERRYRQLQGR